MNDEISMFRLPTAEETKQHYDAMRKRSFEEMHDGVKPGNPVRYETSRKERRELIRRENREEKRVINGKISRGEINADGTKNPNYVSPLGTAYEILSDTDGKASGVAENSDA